MLDIVYKLSSLGHNRPGKIPGHDARLLQYIPRPCGKLSFSIRESIAKGILWLS